MKVSTKTISLIVIPIVIISLQIIIKILTNNPWYDHLGITLSAIGIGQISPLIIEENLLMSKLFKLDRIVKNNTRGSILMKIEYKVTTIDDITKLNDLRLWCVIIFLLCLLLFVITVFLNIGGYHKLIPIGVGSFNCILAWMYFLS